jgi:uncharacterized SAM-binding protein YcdF (DUF218 family)
MLRTARLESVPHTADEGIGDYDAILVPGGGVRDGGTLPLWVLRRLELAVELARGAYIVTLSAGTTHRPPPINKRGFPIFEADAGAKYLIGAGVAADRILVERYSYDTIGNAYFSRVVHVDPQGFRRLMVITSEFHLPRTKSVFEWVYGLTPQAADYSLHFEGVPDDGVDRAALEERREKERQGMDALMDLIPRLTTMSDFHRWLFTEHRAYNAGSKGFGEGNLGGPALESY